MRLLALCGVAGWVMLAAARAHADWRTDVSIPERPNDVLEVWGPERFSVGHPEGAYMFVDGGVAREMLPRSPALESAGTYYQPALDCFVSVEKVQGVPKGVRVSDGASCGSFNAGDPIISSGNLLRLKHSAHGGAVAVAANGVDYGYYLSTTNVYDNPVAFNPVSAFMVNVIAPVGVVKAEGKVYALIGTATNTANVYWVDSDNLGGATLVRPNAPEAGVVQAIDMFPAGNPAKPYAVVGTQNGLLQGSILASPDMLGPVQGLSGGVGSVSMNVGFGGDAGQGFGMAIVDLPDGGLEVASPVPMLKDTEAGRFWRTRSLPGSVASAPLANVACASASYCVFTADQAGGGNIFIYTNDAGPEISATAPGAAVVENPGADTWVTLDEGQIYPLTFVAQDPDGDPVLVTASLPDGGTSVSSGGGTAVLAAGQRPGDPVVWDVVTSRVCKVEELGRFRASATDGLASHEANKTFLVRVNHTQAPELPAVELSDGGIRGSGAVGELVPGGPPLALRLAGNGATAAGCRLQPQWEPLFTGTGVPSLEQDGGTAVIKPPDRFCSPAPGSFDFRLRVTDEGSLSSTSDFNVGVAPWGNPNAVFGPGWRAELTAGEPGLLAPSQPVHVCDDGSGSFPGVDTEWSVTLADGGVPGAGFTFRNPADGSLVQQFPVRAQQLSVETPDCLDTELVVSARHLLRSVAGFSGQESQQRVPVHTVLEPVAHGSLLFELDGGPPPSNVRVASTLNCPERRGDLRANLWIEPLGGGKRLHSGTVSVPGMWEDVPLATLGCGQPLLLKGALEDGTGQRSMESVVQVSTLPVDPGLEALPEGAALVARCGEQARGTLTQTFPPEACQTPDVTWTQEGGPPLEQTELSGQTVSLATRDTGLDSLVGESLVMRVSASAGGNTASQLVSLPITVEPFVKVRRRTEVPAASETGLVGVSVDLLNTTACEVRGVSYVERIEGLTYVEGSAKFDGQPVDATWSEGALTVTGLTLAGEGSGRLTYVARPHLVGERRMEGEARLRNAVISLRDDPGPQVPDSGCGCSGSGPGPVLFALGALVAAVRRRRR